MENEPSEKDQALYAAIGRLTVAWANLEYALDHMVMVFHFAMGNNDAEPQLPRALHRKLDYLRAAFARYFPLQDAEIKYSPFLAAIENEAEHRHDIIHGAQLSQVKGSGEAELQRLLHRKTHWDRKAIKINTESVLAAEQRTQKLNASATNWTVAMLVAYHKHLGQPIPPDALLVLQSL